MAASVGIAANASMVSAHLLCVRGTWPQEVWTRTGRVQLASALVQVIMRQDIRTGMFLISWEAARRRMEGGSVGGLGM